MSSHHSLLPTSGEQAMSVVAIKAAETTAMQDLKRDDIRNTAIH